MLIGYARVSTLVQDTNLQLDALRVACVDVIFEEKTSSVGTRPQLQKALQSLSTGDVLVVYKIDRVARSLKDLLHILERIQLAGAGFKSLTEPIDTSSHIGLFLLQILGAVAQLERSIIRERAIAGQISAIRRGVLIGRPRKFTYEQAYQIFLEWKSGSTKAFLSRKYNAWNSSIDLCIEQFEPTGRKKRPIRPVLSEFM